MRLLVLLLSCSAQPLFAQQSPELFSRNCAGCHGENARGTAKGPGLEGNPSVAEQSADQLSAFLERGNIAAGMPSFADLPAPTAGRSPSTCCALNVGTIIRPSSSAEPAPQNYLGALRSRATGSPTTEMTPPIAIVR